MTKVESRHASAPPTRAALAFYAFVRALILGVSKVLFRIEFHGTEHIPATGSFVLAPGAHRSNLETLVVSGITRRRMRYMGKDSLWKSRLGDWLLSALGGFPVNRSGTDREALYQTLDIVATGEPVVIFPEGTRRTGPLIEEEHMRDGAAYVAARAQVPIVPVGIGGSEAALPPGSKMARPVKMVVIVGEPIDPPPLKESGRVSRKGVQAMTDELRTTLQGLFDEAQRQSGHAT
jgi:1-acyl-sn-glycerol-3-phosphate acyltransferase